MITVTDLFCGAGGSGLGATAVPGVELVMAANHWKLAVDTHQVNFPHADHDCADISQAQPRRYRRTTLLWASPECTNHSNAKGKKRAKQPTLVGWSHPPPRVEDCTFRMLHVAEIQAAMAFRTDYVILGTAKRDRVRQLGNAVTPPAAEFLIRAVVASLTGDGTQAAA